MQTPSTALLAGLARALSEGDPAVAGGFMTARVRPYAVAMWGEHAITPSRAP